MLADTVTCYFWFKSWLMAEKYFQNYLSIVFAEKWQAINVWLVNTICIKTLYTTNKELLWQKSPSWQVQIIDRFLLWSTIQNFYWKQLIPSPLKPWHSDNCFDFSGQAKQLLLQRICVDNSSKKCCTIHSTSEYKVTILKSNPC